MNKSEDILQNGVDLWDSTQSNEDAVVKVLEIKKRIEEKPINEWSMDSLVDHVFTLCKIMDNLSELKDYATLQAEASEEEYDSAVRDKYIELKESGEKITDTMARAKAEQICERYKGKELINRYQARVLNDLYKDCDRLINFTQTKVKSLVDNSIRVNVPNN